MKKYRSAAYRRFLELSRRMIVVDSVNGLLEWDMAVMMPRKEAGIRGTQQATLSSISHEILVSKEMGTLIARLEEDRTLDAIARANVDRMAYAYKRETNIPASLVEELSEAHTKGYLLWETAKRKNDFSIFAPALRRNIDLAIREATLINPHADPYATMFETYERWLPLQQVKEAIAQLAGHATGYVKAARELPTPSMEFLARKIPRAKQQEYNKRIAKLLGYDFGKGRLDESPHPFTAGWRITTRYNDPWMEVIGSTMHETGHGLYEQGIPTRLFGTPIGTAGSMAVHESQSRLWELNVGLGRPFWQHELPKLKKAYAPALDDVELKPFLHAINSITPSVIRLASDEISYVLHIALRLELEQELIAGTLRVHDLPERWNAKTTELFGITPKDDREGCLQDMHWGDGSFGYFPTYVVGTAMASQFYAAAQRDNPGLEESIAHGDCKPLLRWLRANIHRHADRYSTTELIQRATGKPFSADDYIDRISMKIRRKY